MRAAPPHAQQHAAAWRVAQRVVRQVDERLAQQMRVGLHHAVAGRQPGAQPQALAVGLRAVERGDLVQQRRWATGAGRATRVPACKYSANSTSGTDRPGMVEML